MDLPDITITYNVLESSISATGSFEDSNTPQHDCLEPSIGTTGSNYNHNTDLEDINHVPPLTIQESILNSSRITPSGNGNPSNSKIQPDITKDPGDFTSLSNLHSNMSLCTQPTSGQKWWAAVVLGFVFALVSSPVAYYITSSVTTSLGGISLIEGPGPNVPGLLLHTIIFILIVRLILW